MDRGTEKLLTKYLGENISQGSYKVVEYNSTRTYMKVTNYDSNLRVLNTPREVFEGVALADIDSISKTIDITKTLIIKK